MVPMSRRPFVFAKETFLDTHAFDALTRRASLVTLGAAGLAALADPLTTAASKKKRKKGDVNKRCQQQVAAWTAFVPSICADGPNCEPLIACGVPLAVCDFTGFLVCLSSPQAETLVPRFAPRHGG